MMKKAMLLILAALCLLLTGCDSRDPLAEMASTLPDAAIPLPSAPEHLTGRENATLWFRFGDEPFLAPEERIIDTTPTRTFEQSLLTALIGGPAASDGLRGLFPPGTQVLGTWQQGRMLFVTLSKEILGDYPDESSLWGQDAAHREESSLRRTLAMQSIAATITQNCPVDSVIILVHGQEQFTDSLRLRESYYGSSGGALADPLTRNEKLLLTPLTAMDVILTCWQERDWARLYLYAAHTDPESGALRPEYEVFAAEMNRLPHLTGYTCAGGHAADGLATLTASLTFLQDGRELPAVSAVFRLKSEGGVWRIGMSQLTARKEVQP